MKLMMKFIMKIINYHYNNERIVILTFILG